jgi:membrane-associated phospholipid phosphatase
MVEHIESARANPIRRAIPARVLFVAVLLSLATPSRGGDRYDLIGEREAAIYGVGIAGGFGALMVQRGQSSLLPDQLASLDPAQVNGFDRFATGLWSPAAATASDVLLVGTAAAPLLLLAETGAGMSSGDLLVMYSQTQLLQAATVAALKGAFGRIRPYAYNDDPRIAAQLAGERGAVRSFPSGHTATTFAAAVFMGEIHARLNPHDAARHWVRGGTLALAAVTGWLRIQAGRHFPTDVLAGAAIGALIGWAVPRLHEVEDDPAGGAKAAPIVAIGFGF